MTENEFQPSSLVQGAWQPEVHQALIELIETHGINSPNYDPERPPLAAIDCDGTLIHHDVGEAMMRFMITRRRIQSDRGFWNSLVPDRFGRDALNAAYKAVAGRHDSEVHETAAYRRYRTGMIGVYEKLLAYDGVESAYMFAASMIRGLHERTVSDLVDEVLDHELDRNLGSEEIPAGPPFAGQVAPTGIRVYHEMLDLLNILQANGFSTWLVSSSNVYVLRALARRIGFPEDRVLGIEFQVQGGRYTDRVVEPAPIGEGKLELFLDTVGRSPVLVLGDSMNDYELLENCEGLCVVMDRGDEELVERAQEHGWPVQGLLSV